jgi:hypothetical protein
VGCELALVDQGLEVRVVEDVAEFVLHVAVVDVDPDGADLEHGPQRLHPLHAVEGVDSHVISGPDALLGQVVCQAVRPRLHLGEAAPHAVGHQVLVFAEVIGGVLEEIGEVELHGSHSAALTPRGQPPDTLSSHVSSLQNAPRTTPLT